jgi:hypothetical protein
MSQIVKQTISVRSGKALPDSFLFMRKNSCGRHSAATSLSRDLAVLLTKSSVILRSR